MVAGDGRVCAAGAVYKSIYRQEIIRPGQYYRTMVELQEELGNEYDGTFMSVTEFNDVRAQSQQDIEDLFTKTIRRLQEEQ
jgi:hypothetical protein